MPHLDLDDGQADALATLLTRTIADDHYPLSPRIRTLKGDPREAQAGDGPGALSHAVKPKRR